MESSESKSVYRYGAEYGRWVGIYLIIMSACFMASLHFPACMLVMAVMLACLPFVLYRYLRRMYLEAPQNRSFAALWMGGIMTVICASLICALVTAAWLLTVQPHFFEEYLAMAIKVGENAPDASRYAEQIEVLKKGLDGGLAPSPMRFVLSMIWSTVFLGSILSMACAWILRLRRPEMKTPRQSGF